MVGNITKDYNGNITYDIEYTWNDIIDPNYQYFSDFLKVLGLNIVNYSLPEPVFTLNNYDIHISWHDTTIINESDPTVNSGWLKEYDEEYITNSKNFLKYPTGWWDRYTKQGKKRLQEFIDKLEKWKEEHPEYYEDC